MTYSRNSITLYAHGVLDTSVMSSSPDKLISMLFNAAQIAVLKAQQAMQADDETGRTSAIAKAIEIIDNGLRTSLRIRDADEQAHNLNRLYFHITQRLAQAEVSNDPAHLHEVLKLLSDLKSAWEGIKPLIAGRTELYYLPRSAGRTSVSV